MSNPCTVVLDERPSRSLERNDWGFFAAKGCNIKTFRAGAEAGITDRLALERLSYMVQIRENTTFGIQPSLNIICQKQALFPE